MREPSSSSTGPSAFGAGPAPRPGPRPTPPTALELLRALLSDIPRMIGERVQLLTLELKRARQALVVIAVLVVVALLLLLTAWFVLWGAVIAGLVAAGLAWGWAVLIVLILNIGGALGALIYAGSLGRFLALPATMRHLTLATHNPGKAPASPFTAPAADGALRTGSAPSAFAPGTGPAAAAAAAGNDKRTTP